MQTAPVAVELSQVVELQQLQQLSAQLHQLQDVPNKEALALDTHQLPMKAVAVAVAATSVVAVGIAMDHNPTAAAVAVLASSITFASR